MWWFFKKSKQGSSKIIAKAIEENNLTEVKKYVNSDNVNDECAKGVRPIHLAIQHAGPEVTKYLLDQGANCKSLTNNGDSPLLLAVRARNLEVIKILLEHNDAIETIDWHSVVKGDNPLSYAFISGDEEMANLLYKYNPDVRKARISGCGELEARLKFAKNFPNAGPEEGMQDSLLQGQEVMDILGADELPAMGDAA